MQPASTGAPGARPQAATEAPDIKEYGAPKDGTRQSTDRRLYVQILAYTECLKPQALADALGRSGLEAVLYLDVNDPRGVGLALLSEDPAQIAEKARGVLASEPFASLKPRIEFTMFGRTYSLGHEQDLEDWLLRKPRRNLFDAAFPWHVWYPLRRKGEFEKLPKDQQREILMEHARIGMSYGAAGLAHDVRLACHGLDPNDNEFMLGLVSPHLHAISRLIQDMRKTEQTARYIQSMGPFFVGRVFYRTQTGGSR